MKTHLLAPSDLSYLYDRCPRCYWLKLKGVVGPKDHLPAVFRDIDTAQKAGVTIEAIRKLGIPALEFVQREKVVSIPREFGGSMLAISGFTDRRVRLESGNIGVLDFKTSAPRPDNLSRYWRAMSAYQYALENIENPDTVELLALVVFSPSGFKLRPEDPRQAFFMGSMMRMDIEIDRPKFERLLEKVGKLLASDEMPKAGSCDTCRHVDTVVGMRMNQLLDQITANAELGPELAAKIAATVRL